MWSWIKNNARAVIISILILVAIGIGSVIIRSRRGMTTSTTTTTPLATTTTLPAAPQSAQIPTSPGITSQPVAPQPQVVVVRVEGPVRVKIEQAGQPATTLTSASAMAAASVAQPRRSILKQEHNQSRRKGEKN